MSTSFDIAALDFEGNGLVTVVAQDARTGVVLMVAHADRTALEHTLATGEMHYHSRQRGLWRKGATSGNVQRVISLAADCDGDAVLARVLTQGPACHTGDATCFARGEEDEGDALHALDRVVADRARDDANESSSYTRRLLNDRNRRLKKIGEEAVELVTALADCERDRAVEEASDLVYHLLVALHAVGATWADVQATLARRAMQHSEIRGWEGPKIVR